MPAEIAQAVREKQRADQSKLAELISRGTPVSKPRTGVDGGMHPVFANKLPDAQSIAMTDATDFTVASYGAAPGTIPAHVNPPKLPDAPETPDYTPTTQESGPMNTTATGNSGAVRGGFFSSLAAKVGLKNEKQDTASTQQAAPSSAALKSRAIPKTSTETARSSEPASAPRVIPLDRQKQTQTATAQAKSPFPDPPASVPQPAPAATQSMAGAQPAIPANSFDSKWSSYR